MGHGWSLPARPRLERGGLREGAPTSIRMVDARGRRAHFIPSALEVRVVGHGSRLTVVALSLAAGAPELACAEAERSRPAARPSSPEEERRAMVRDQLESRGIRDARVLDAMRTLPRHRFVPDTYRHLAHADGPLPIGRGQTISQPYVVARMAEALQLRGTERILEVGSGSGYAAAVLSLVGAEVYGIELEEELHARSVATIGELGYPNVHLRAGDGFRGWPERAPFDAIVLSCAVERIPEPLWAQLADGGRVVYPRGPEGTIQQLVVVTKTREGPREERLAPVQFVPLRRGSR
jgi:protein-L-isoaspartate(D-aspartate) O-methyltransferase